MLLLDLFDRVGREVPGAPMSGFVASVNGEVERLWKVRKWDHFVTEVSMSTTHSFDNLQAAWEPSSETQFITDSDSNGLFDDLHVGKQFTVDGTAYAVLTVVSANVCTIDGQLDLATGVEGSLPRVVFPLPNGEVVDDVAAPIFRTMMKVFRQGEEQTSVLLERCEYILRYPSSGVTTLELRTVLSGDTPYIVRFLRAPVKATGLGDTVDLGEILDECIYWALEFRYRSKRPPVSEMDMLPWQRLASQAQERWAQELKGAKAAETLKHARRGRNQEVVFRL